MISKIFLATCLIGFVFACAAAPPRLFLKDRDRYIEAGQIISGATGAPVTFDEMLADLVAGHEAVARTARAAFAVADGASDQPTADLVTQRLQVHEKTAWMLRSMLA